MPLVKATTHSDTLRFIQGGVVKKIELDYSIDSDEFFQLASEWCEKGAKIKKDNGNFVITLKAPSIPPND